MYTAMLPRQHLHIQGHAATTYRWPCCHTIYTNMLLQHIEGHDMHIGFPKRDKETRYPASGKSAHMQRDRVPEVLKPLKKCN